MTDFSFTPLLWGAVLVTAAAFGLGLLVGWAVL